ncbi:MAG: acyl carrier protein [Lachnospiraceae bacterium]|nr:acyl carrier protein [Lachnospiraceae bacterium]
MAIKMNENNYETNIEINNETTAKIIIEIIHSIDSGCESLIKTGDERIVDDLGFDSISIMELIFEIEQRFKVDFEGEMLLVQNFDTINILAEFVQKLVIRKRI